MKASNPAGDERAHDDPLAVRTSADAGCVLVTVAGEIDMATAPRLRAALREAFRQRPDTIVVDLDGVSYFGSHGTAVLLDAHADAQRIGSTLLIRLDRDHRVRGILAVTGVDTILAVQEGGDESVPVDATGSHD